MSSTVSVKQQFEAEICGADSKRSIDEKVKIVKYFLHNRQIIFPSKSASIVRCLFFLSKSLVEQENENSILFTEILQMLLVAVDKYPGEFILAQNVNDMVKLIGKFSLLTANDALVCHLISKWFTLTKDLEDIDRLDFCFDILESFGTPTLASGNLKNLTTVLALIVETFEDIAELLRNAQKMLQDEKETMLKILCQLDPEPQLWFLTPGKQGSTKGVKEYHEQLSLILRMTMFKDVLELLKDKKPALKKYIVEICDLEKNELSEKLGQTMRCLDDTAGVHFCMFGCWLREVGKISQERINPLPLICDIIDGILSEELAFPKDEPVYKCKALTNLLVALHDTHNNENWARNFDPKSLQKQFYRVLQEFSLTKEQISSTTGESSEKLDLIVSISLLEGDLVLKSSSCMILTAAALDIGHKNFLSVSFDYFANSHLVKYFSQHFLPTLKVFLTTTGNQSSLRKIVENDLIGEVYAKYLCSNACMDLEVALELILLFLDFCCTNREKCIQMGSEASLTILVLHFLKVFLENMVDDRIQVLSPLKQSISKVVHDFNLLAANEDSIISSDCQKLCDSISKVLSSMCSKFDLKNEMEIVENITSQCEIGEVQERGYLDCFLHLKSLGNDAKEKDTGLKKLVRKICKNVNVEQLKNLMSDKSAFEDVHFQNLLFTELSSRNVEFLAFILTQDFGPKVFNFARMEWNLVLDAVSQFQNVHENVFCAVSLRCEKIKKCRIEPDIAINIISAFKDTSDNYRRMSDVVRMVLKTAKESVEFLQNFVLQFANRNYELFIKGEVQDMRECKMLSKFLCLLAVSYPHDMKDLFLPKTCKIIKKLAKDSETCIVSFKEENELDMLYHLYLRDSETTALNNISLEEVFAKFSSMKDNASILSCEFLLHLWQRLGNDLKLTSPSDVKYCENSEYGAACSIETIANVLQKLVASGVKPNQIETVVAFFSASDARLVFLHLLRTDLLSLNKRFEASEAKRCREPSFHRIQNPTALEILMVHPELKKNSNLLGEILLLFVQLMGQMDSLQKIYMTKFLLIGAREYTNFISEAQVPLLRALDTICDGNELVVLLDVKTELIFCLIQKKIKWLNSTDLTFTLTHIFQSLLICCSTRRKKKIKESAREGKTLESMSVRVNSHGSRQSRKKLSTRGLLKRSEGIFTTTGKKSRKRRHGDLSGKPQGSVQSGESLVKKMERVIEVDLNDKWIDQLKRIIARLDWIVKAIRKQQLGKVKNTVANMLACFLYTRRTFVLRLEFMEMISQIISNMIDILEDSNFFDYILTNCTAAEKVVLTQFRKQ